MLALSLSLSIPLYVSRSLSVSLFRSLSLSLFKTALAPKPYDAVAIRPLKHLIKIVQTDILHSRH